MARKSRPFPAGGNPPCPRKRGKARRHRRRSVSCRRPHEGRRAGESGACRLPCWLRAPPGSMRFALAHGRPGGHPPPPCPRRLTRWSARRRKEGPEMQCSRRHASSDAVLPSTPASQSSRLKNSCFSSVAPARRCPSGVSRTSRPATSTSDRDDRPARALVTLGLLTPSRSAILRCGRTPARRGSRGSPRGSPQRIRSHRCFRTSSHQPRSFPEKEFARKTANSRGRPRIRAEARRLCRTPPL